MCRKYDKGVFKSTVEMFLDFLIIIYLSRTTFCEVFGCQDYLNRRVAGVFHYDRNSRYSLTFMEAKQACEKDFAAVIASRGQLQAANEAGMEECRAGWIAGAEVAYPRVHLNWNCGQNQTGIISYGVRRDLLEKWDVFCYKMDDDCATLMGAEPPDLPRLKLRGNGSSEGVKGHLDGANRAEQSKAIKMAAGSHRLRLAASIIPATTSTSNKREYMIYSSGPGTETPSSYNGLTRGIEGPSDVNNEPSQEFKSDTDGQTLSIPLTAFLQEDQTKGEYQTSSGDRMSVPSTTWEIQSLTLQMEVSSTNILDNKPASFVINEENVSFDVSDPPLVSTFFSTNSETDSNVQLKQIVETGSENNTPNGGIKVNITEVTTLSSTPSPDVTAHRPLRSFEGIPVPTSETFASAADVAHTPIVATLESFTEKVLAEQFEPACSMGATSCHDRKTSSIHSVHTAEELESEEHESGTESKSPKKYKSIEKYENTEEEPINIDKLYPIAISPSVNTPNITTVRQIPFSLSTATSADEDTTLLTTKAAYQNTTDLSEILVNEPNAAIIFVPPEEGQRHEQLQGTVFSVNEPSTDVNVSDVQQGLSFISTTVLPTLSNQNFDKTLRRPSFQTLNESLPELEATMGDLDDRRGSASNGTAASSKQSHVDLNKTQNGSYVAVTQLFAEHAEPSRTVPILATSSSATHSPLKYTQTHKLTSVLNHATLANETFIPSVTTTVQNNGTHTPTPTLTVTVRNGQGPKLYTKTTAPHMSTYFKEENIRTSPQTTVALLQYSGSLKTTSEPLVTTMTSSLLDLTIGSTSQKPETTTTKSCGGLLEEEEGEFHSPGFPQAYLSDMDCTWVISAQQGHLVRLTFHSMVLEQHRGCRYDYIAVFDGRASEKRELGRFCGSELPPPLRSSSNTMTIQMRSDSSVELDGFSAHFHSIKSTAVFTGNVQLRGGRNQFEGHVEVDFEGVQGGICAKHWRNNEAMVVCRQLGFMGNAVSARTPERVGDLPLSLSFVKCRGDEHSLDQCEIKRGGVCSSADRAIVHCQVVESCSVLRESGVRESGTYIIDPDGARWGQDPFPVHCDMDSQPGAGVTVVSHDSELRVRVGPCEEAGCYSREVVYQQASLPQLRALIQTSFSCSQKVKLECRHIRFLGTHWGWWTSWDGRRVDSWGGAATGSRRCACGERGDCDLGLLTCNCDANDAVWRSDEGFLLDMALLPVREVRFGDTRDVPMEMAFHTIGPLRCEGHKSREPVLENCAALKEAGVVQSGRYIIDPDGVGYGISPFEVYCDMTSDPLTGVTVVGHDGEGRERVSPCEEPGCYSRELRYKAELPQLHALAQTSASCRQHVKLDCRHTRFVESGWGWWVTWTGQKRLDWGGAKNNSGSCGCGVTGTCGVTGHLCNCDSNDHIWRSDEGFLTDRDALPVSAVHFGDTRDTPLEMAFHTIGKFTCRGRASPTF